MADDKSAALVVALSARLDKFEKDMRQAGDIADKTVSGIEDRFSRSNPSFSGSFLGNFLGSLATKGIEAAVKLASDLVDRFIDLEKVSKLVGVSMNELFGQQQAASKFHVPVDDTTKSVKALAVLLDQMQRGEKNSLSELFDANPAALKGVNVEALNLQQTFAIVADLVRNGRTEIQKIDLAKAAGQTETMVRFLEQGGNAVTFLSKNAAALAPDLQKIADSAKAFDEAWRTAVTNVKSYLGEHLFDIVKNDLVDIIALLGGAVTFLRLFKGGLIDGSTQSAAAELEKLRAALLNFKNAREQVDESAGLDTSKNARNDRRVGAKSEPRQAGTSTVDSDKPLSNVPLKHVPRELQSSFDRTEEQITKHTATINADTIAVSQNSAVQAQLRAEFQLLNAIRKDDGEVTQAQIDQYTKLRASMSAEMALEQAKINLSPTHKQSFIAASEGAALATAANTRAVDSVQKLNSASSTLGSALASSFADATLEAKSFNDVMTSLLKNLARASINATFASFFNQQAGGGLSPFASLLGFGGARAGGGPVDAGKAYLVGEKRPELFVPGRSGTIIPNVVSSGGRGGSTFAPVTTIDARGMDPAAVGRFGAIMQRHERVLQQMVKSMQSGKRYSTTGVY